MKKSSGMSICTPTRRFAEAAVREANAARLNKSSRCCMVRIIVTHNPSRPWKRISNIGAHVCYSFFSPQATQSDMSASAARAQSTSFCTVGAPLSPIAPTTSPFTLMGNPPPHAAKRGSVGMPAKSDGSPWIKSKKLLRGDAEQSRVRLILRNLNGRDRGPIHPAKGP